MIRAVLFDLGDTLVAEDQVLPGAIAALSAISALDAGAGPPALGLVSDWEDPGHDCDADAIARSVARYVALVDGFGLLPFFTPTDRRITLSTEVGVRKPDRRVFAKALARLGLGDDFASALLVTENAEHIAAARALGMSALRFGPGGDFERWDDAPALVAPLVGASVDAVADEAVAHEQMLRDNHRVARPGEPLEPGQTHADDPVGGPPNRRHYSIR